MSGTLRIWRIGISVMLAVGVPLRNVGTTRRDSDGPGRS